jgi:hypothetical protein
MARGSFVILQIGRWTTDWFAIHAYFLRFHATIMGNAMPWCTKPPTRLAFSSKVVARRANVTSARVAVFEVRSSNPIAGLPGIRQVFVRDDEPTIGAAGFAQAIELEAECGSRLGQVDRRRRSTGE